MDVEFKLFGGLTVNEFVGLAMWLLIALFIYMLGLPKVIGYPLIGLCLFLGIGFAFWKVHDQPFSKWLGNFVIAMVTSQTKVWQKANKVPAALTRQFSLPPSHKNQTTLAAREQMTDEIIERVIRQENIEKNMQEEQIFQNIDRYLGETGMPRSMGENFAKNSQFQVSKITTPPPIESGVVQDIKSVQDNQTVRNFEPPQQTATTQKTKSIEQIPFSINSVIANVVVGRVVDKAGSPVNSASVMIIDSQNEVVRQTLTNLNGVFKFTTALPDGKYIAMANLKGHKFTQIELQLDGTNEKVITIHET